MGSTIVGPSLGSGKSTIINSHCEVAEQPTSGTATSLDADQLGQLENARDMLGLLGSTGSTRRGHTPRSVMCRAVQGPIWARVIDYGTVDGSPAWWTGTSQRPVSVALEVVKAQTCQAA